MFNKISKATLLALSLDEVNAADFVNGLNMPWDQCGNDWGVSYKTATFDTHLSKYKASGANTVRQWIHFDGNKQLSLYDNKG